MSIDFEVEKRKSSKTITLVYGGLSIEDNPTKLACEKIEEVLTELGQKVVSFNLMQHHVEDVIEALSNSAGVVLATTVEWFGVGHLMQQFLDTCYLLKREDMFAEIPLFSVVFSRNAKEKEASDYLNTAWQMLGGWKGVELYGTFTDRSALLADTEALIYIEKKTEQFYRYGLNQSYQLPRSFTGEERMAISKQPALPREQQETPVQEEMSNHKKNVVALSEKLKAKLEEKTKTSKLGLVDLLTQKYKGATDSEYIIQFQIIDNAKENVAALIKPSGIYCYLGVEEEPVLTLNVEEEFLRQILEQKISFQRAFMTGKITVKGELNLLYKMDEFF